MAVSKVEFNGETLVDLTGDSVTPESLTKGTTAHNAAGEPITGTGEYIPVEEKGAANGVAQLDDEGVVPVNQLPTFVVSAQSADGKAYTATLDGVTELYEGLTIKIIPNVVSSSTTPTLNLNGLGAVRIALLTTMNNAAVVTPTIVTWLSASHPVEVTYHVQRNTAGTVINTYWIVEWRRTTAATIYGQVPVQNGGWFINSETTEEDKSAARDALLNLGIGETGADGKSAYKYAQDGGYTGTEEEFSEKLASEYVKSVNGATPDANGNVTVQVQAEQIPIVDSIDEMTDTSKRYVLKSTGTIHQYKETTYEGTVTDIIESTADNPVHEGYYVSKGALTARVGNFVTPYINIGKYSGQIALKVKGATCLGDSATNYNRMDKCDENCTFLGAAYMTLASTANTNYVVTALCDSADKVIVDGDTTTFIIDLPRLYVSTPIHYIRFTCGEYNGTQTWATTEISISYQATITEKTWVDTGVSFGGNGIDEETLAEIAKISVLNNEGASPSTIKLLPAPVLDFYNAAAYTDGDYSYSHLSAATYPCRADVPVPFLVKWEHNENAMRTTVAVDNTKAIGTLNRFTMRTYDATGRDMFPIYNLLPNHTYYYKVTHVMADGSLVEAKSGSFTTSGEPWRLIYIDGTQNVRDLGGRTGLDGKTVKYGQIFRGAAFSDSYYPELMLTGKGRRALGDLDVQAELNLGAVDTETSIAANCAYMKIGYSNYTNAITDATRREQFKTALEWIVTQLTASKPIYMHCQGGCDRTGTLAFQLLGLLGVSESDLAKDYELSHFSDIGLGRYRNSTTYDYSGMVAAIKAYSGATITDKFYDFATTGCGVSADTITSFRSLMLG